MLAVQQTLLKTTSCLIHNGDTIDTLIWWPAVELEMKRTGHFEKRKKKENRNDEIKSRGELGVKINNYVKKNKKKTTNGFDTVVSL